VEKYGRAREATDNIIGRMHIACRITEATDVYSEYIMLIAFLREQRLGVRVSILRYTYTACLVSTDIDCTYRFRARVSVELFLVVYIILKRWQKRSSVAALTSGVVLDVIQLIKQMKSGRWLDIR
jgi:hypothetical protein